MPSSLASPQPFTPISFSLATPLLRPWAWAALGADESNPRLQQKPLHVIPQNPESVLNDPKPKPATPEQNLGPAVFDGKMRARVQQSATTSDAANSQETSTDEGLMDAYCAGDTEAFNTLFVRFTDRLVRFLSNMVGRDKAKDLTQLTFMKIHENRHRYRAGASVAAWFFAIARNNALDYVRSAPKRREVFGLEIDHAADTPNYDRLRDERVRAALAQLSDEQQQVIQLHWFGELTFNEVAEAVNATPAAVRVRAHRGYEKLRGFLADLEAEVVS